MAGTILIGTCSWTDRSLIESTGFYPSLRMTAEERLRYYASHFPIVEVDSTYYSLPTVRNAQLWAERTPEGFIFDVKAFRLFTGHWAEAMAFPSDLARELPSLQGKKRGYYYEDVTEEIRSELWQRFEEALEPLHQASKLGLVLFQFPQYVYPSPRVDEHILAAKERLRYYRLAIEFRNQTWVDERHRERTFRFLRDHDLAFVCVDEPQGFRSSLPPLAEATSDIAYVRFHGRKTATWEKPGVSASDRFDWYYTEEELGEWVPRLHHLQERARQVHALMNTNRGDQGPANARLLAKVLQVPMPGIS